MTLKKIDGIFSVCKVKNLTEKSLKSNFCFVGKTDEELSLVCLEAEVPNDAYACENGWRAFRIEGILDFSLTGILSHISGILAENNIGIFAVSTFNTDYILVKSENFEKSLNILHKKGFKII